MKMTEKAAAPAFAPAADVAAPPAVAPTRATVFLSDGTTGRCFGRGDGLTRLRALLPRGTVVVERPLARPPETAAAAAGGPTPAAGTKRKRKRKRKR